MPTPHEAVIELKHVGAVEIKDAERGEIRAIIARTEALDHDGDWTLRGAIPDGTKVKFSAYGHSVVRDGARPVGRGTITTQGDTVFVDGKFFMSTVEGRETFYTLKELAEGGDAQEWSYGFEILERGEVTPELKAKGVHRVLAKVRPLEVSPVLVGAGVDTGTVALKMAMASIDGQNHTAPDFAYTPDLEDASTWRLPIFNADQVRAALAQVGQTDIPAEALSEVKLRIRDAAEKFGVSAEGLEDVKFEEAKARAARESAEVRAREQRMLEESAARFARTRSRLGW